MTLESRLLVINYFQMYPVYLALPSVIVTVLPTSALTNLSIICTVNIKKCVLEKRSFAIAPRQC